MRNRPNSGHDVYSTPVKRVAHRPIDQAHVPSVPAKMSDYVPNSQYLADSYYADTDPESLSGLYRSASAREQAMRQPRPTR
jgi:hypothetical protein